MYIYILLYILECHSNVHIHAYSIYVHVHRYKIYMYIHYICTYVCIIIQTYTFLYCMNKSGQLMQIFKPEKRVSLQVCTYICMYKKKQHVPQKCYRHVKMKSHHQEETNSTWGKIRFTVEAKTLLQVRQTTPAIRTSPTLKQRPETCPDDTAGHNYKSWDKGNNKIPQFTNYVPDRNSHYVHST